MNKLKVWEWWATWRAQVICGAFALAMALLGGLFLGLAIRAASAPGVTMVWPWYSTALVVVTAVLWTLSFGAAILGVGERLTKPNERDDVDDDEEPGGVST